MTDVAMPLPPAAVIVSHTVADFDQWKKAFDGHEPARRGAGMLGHHVNRGEGDSNLVSVYVALSDLEKARAFADSEDLRDTMAAAGVTSPPDLTWVEPLHEAVVWDRELPAAIVRFEVADSDTWLEVFKRNSDMRASKGIIGEAANRLIDDPSRVVVYLQAETFDALRAFRDSPELKAAMQEAGVTSAPEVTYHTGGWAKQYE